MKNALLGFSYPDGAFLLTNKKCNDIINLYFYKKIIRQIKERGIEMKKIISIIIAAIMLFSIGLTAFADMGSPPLEEYTVYVCPDGLDVTVELEEDTVVSLKPGAKYTFYKFENDDYYWLGSDEPFVRIDSYYEVYMIKIESSQLNSLIRDGSVVSPNYGTNIGEAKKGRVTADGGLVMRMGPSTNYPKRGSIKKGTIVTYSYVWNGDWAYVEYNGTQGWISLAYVSSNIVTTTRQTTTAASSSVKSSTEADNVSELSGSEENTEAILEIPTEEITSAPGTVNTILICIICGLLVALTAVIVLLIVSKKKQNSNNNQNDTELRY